MPEDKLERMNRMLHRFIENLGLHSLGRWSELLEGISNLDLHVLRMASENADIILKDIRDPLDIPHSTMTSVIDRLEKRGLLKRIISKRDRRSFGLELTEEGWKIQNEHDRIDRLGSTMILEALGDEREAERFIDMLSRICRRFEGELEAVRKGENDESHD